MKTTVSFLLVKTLDHFLDVSMFFVWLNLPKNKKKTNDEDYSQGIDLLAGGMPSTWGKRTDAKADVQGWRYTESLIPEAGKGRDVVARRQKRNSPVFGSGVA